MTGRTNDAMTGRANVLSDARMNVAVIEFRLPGHFVAPAIPDVPHSDESPHGDGALYSHG